MLEIYNTFTHKKEPFIPLIPKEISLYVCGITVYDYCHLGHARVFVAFDVIVRFLRSTGWKVKYVRNITDIDDKITLRAHQNNETIQALTSRFIDAMNQDAKALNVISPDEEPRATHHIDKIIGMVETLIDKDYAYVAKNNDVYFKVDHYASYGQLAHKDLEQLHSGARVEVNEQKRSALDFVLWKKNMKKEFRLIFMVENYPQEYLGQHLKQEDDMKDDSRAQELMKELFSEWEVLVGETDEYRTFEEWVLALSKEHI